MSFAPGIQGSQQWPRTPLWLRWRALPEWAVSLVMLATTVTAVITDAQMLPGDKLLAGYLALCVPIAACVAAQWWRARWVALGVATLASFAALLAGVDPIIYWNLALFAVFLVVLRGIPVWWALLPASANYAAVVVTDHNSWSDPTALVAGLSILAFAAVAVGVRTSRNYWDQVHLRSRELASAQDVAVARGVADERLRIARELHDLIGHEIAVVNMRLGAAEVHLDDSPTQAKAELDAARDNIQTILSETQRLLTVLRTSTNPIDGLGDIGKTGHIGGISGSDGTAKPSDPSVSTGSAQPLVAGGYEQIPQLISELQKSGLQVEATFPEEAPRLSAECDRAAYRIAQESLTNAAKHGRGAASIRIGVSEEWVIIDTVNSYETPRRRRLDTYGAGDRARRTPSYGSGYGLIGMRERVDSVGGRLDITHEGGIFETKAWLPREGGSAGR